MSPEEKEQAFAFLKRNNAKTDIDLIKADNPDLNDDEALALYTKNKAFNTANAIGIELEATGQPSESAPNNLEAESQAKLRGSVGGVNGILGIQLSVSNGTTQYNSAVEILSSIYGFSESEAKAILGNPIDKTLSTATLISK
jgi:hypothetical protein